MVEEFLPPRRSIYWGVAVAVFFSFVAIGHVGIIYHFRATSWLDWFGIVLALAFAWLMMLSVRAVARSAVRLENDGIATGDGRFVPWGQVVRVEPGKGWGLLGWSEEHLIVHYDTKDGKHATLRFTERLTRFARLKEILAERVRNDPKVTTRLPRS